MSSVPQPRHMARMAAPADYAPPPPPEKEHEDEPKGFGGNDDDDAAPAGEDVEKAANALKFLRGEAEKALELGFDSPVAPPAKLKEVFTLPEKRKKVVVQEKRYEDLPGPRIFVGNLPRKLQVEKDLKAIFKQGGVKGITQIRPILAKKTNTNKYTRDRPCAGFAFLTFEDDETASVFMDTWNEKLVTFGRGEKAKERTLKVFPAKEKEQPQQEGEGDDHDGTSSKASQAHDNEQMTVDVDKMVALFVGGLPHMSGLHRILRRHFDAPGVVKIVPILEDKESGQKGQTLEKHRRRCRGFGYVFIDTPEHAEAFKTQFHDSSLTFKSNASGEEFTRQLRVEDAKKLTNKQKRALARTSAQT